MEGANRVKVKKPAKVLSNNGEKISDSSCLSKSTAKYARGSVAHSRDFGMEKKAKLRTSKDVYNRLKWDSCSLDINVSEVYIGYKDRFLGMCEINFPDFNPCSDEGDIPFHRIYYFRGGGPPISPFIGKDGEIRVREDNWPPNAVIYWDRESRFDRIFCSGETLDMKHKYKETGGAAKILTPVPDNYSAVPVYRFEVGSFQWEQVEAAPPSAVLTSIKNLKLMSLNVLYELHDPDIVLPYNRWPYLIDFLENSDADIIALQEVTPCFLSILERQNWVRENYFLTDISNQAETIRPYGQIFLSKFQPNQLFFSQQFSKRFIIACFPIKGQSHPLHIMNVHLKSNYKGDSSKVRQKQLNQILTTFSQLDSSNSASFLIVGDTNITSRDIISYTNSRVKMVDVWDEAGPTGDFGWTFNIDENSLAKRLSRNAKHERFDRVLINAECKILKPIKIQVTAKSQIDLTIPPKAKMWDSDNERDSNSSKHQELWISDHYALECLFEVKAESDAVAIVETRVQDSTTEKGASSTQLAVVNTSAVAFVPPSNIWSHIQETRSRYDPSYIRWPPHINLVYGFIPDYTQNFSKAQAKFKAVLAKICPFPIRFTKVAVFEHSKASSTICLTTSASDAEKLKSLHALLQALYPNCNSQSKYPHGFTPHLTIAKLSTTSEERRIAKQIIAEWEERLLNYPMEFLVDRIDLLSRKLNHPFRIKKTVPIGATDLNQNSDFLKDFIVQQNLIPSPIKEETQESAFKEIRKLSQKAAGEVSVHLVGSRFLGFHDDSSDMDILVCGPRAMSNQCFFEALVSAYESTKKARIKLLSIVLDALVPIARFRLDSLEIDLVYCPCGANNSTNVTDSQLIDEPETFVRSIDGVREAYAISLLIPHQWWETYCAGIRILKHWAKRRKIYGKVMGYLSSNTISLLLAKVILVNGVSSDPWTLEELIVEFFDFYSNWKWPSAVTFHDATTQIVTKFLQKTTEPMPICSPSFPYLNRARNITKSTRALIQKEIIRANRIWSKISENFEEKWASFIFPENFFMNYPLYVRIQVKCENPRDLSLCEGVLRSKFINLNVELEKRGVVSQPSTEIFLKENSVTTFIGCDVEIDTNTHVEEANQIFRSRLHKSKWLHAIVSELEVSITQVKRDDESLKPFQEGGTENAATNAAMENHLFPKSDLHTKNEGIPNMETGTSSIGRTRLLCLGVLILGTLYGIRKYLIRK